MCLHPAEGSRPPAIPGTVMRRKLSFRHIETVHAIILTGSVTGAATRLHVTQPAISNVLRDAEERLGFLLFDRRGGRLVPTPGADMLFEEIEKSFIGLDAINAFCQRIEQDQRQRISIACTPAFGATVLPRLAATYARQYPDIFFSVHSRVAHHVAALIGSRKADIGFALEVPDIPGVDSELLAELPMLCYLPPGHRLARQAVVEPSQLLDEPMISLSRIEGIEDVVERLFEPCGAMPVPVAECPAAISACGMVAEGLGFMLFDGLPAQLFGASRLSVLPLSSSRRLSYRAYWLKSRTQELQPRALIELARDILLRMGTQEKRESR
ncbi:LysR family transcriptional regulator [Cupriavidus cauae]|uniref:LysR family transcriptional regulator n=2 Tax=Burkholderiaceae TaxID=119060 RepID=A0A5M8AT43_9BURK|nr:LysR family transcriptional regulator [Cupriavidus cauae]